MGPPHLVLQALGVGDLADITLEELKDKIIHAQPEKPPREQLLQILMGWLHEQIKKDIQQKGMLADFVNLLLSGEGLQQQPFEQSEIRAAYKEMQSENPAEFSVQRRRYEMVESDMNALFRRIDSGLDPVAHSSVDTHIPVDINNGESEPQWIVGGGKRKSGANEIPLGQRAAPQLPSRKKARHDNVHRKLLKINKENERVSTRAPKTDVPDVEQPSNLAGELMIMNEANLSNTLSTSAPDTSTKMVGPSSISPPESYICKRCKGPGKIEMPRRSNLSTDLGYRTLDSILPYKSGSKMGYASSPQL
ncbi:hypothetical protein F5Y05DRAFT_227031 [Hypoxylon sp. FL0543]|nr:hypothetical protein F5Y05DRAFT_227031 [Hypoxylon sp. FL0543]